MVTQKQIADQAGVSRALVSHVLNGRTDLSINATTRARILRISQKLGYKSPRRRESKLSHRVLAVGLEIHAVEGFANPLYAEYLQAATETAEEQGYHFLLFNPRTNGTGKRKIISAIEEERVEGVLHIGPIENDLLEQCRKAGLPVSIAGSQTDRDDVDQVLVSTPHTTRMEIDYLYQMGHRNICTLGRPKSSRFHHIPGRKEALEALGLSSSMIMEFPKNCNNEIDRQAGHEFAMEFLRRRDAAPWSKATVLACSNDLVAMGVLEVFMREGDRVPDDISVMGAGDFRGSENTFPPLTTVHTPKAAIGKLATERLIARVENPDELPQKIFLPCRIMERESVANLNNAE